MKIALTSSGGGVRAMLGGAGVVQALDGRDSDVSTSGLYQAITYHGALSGGAWLLSSLVGNDYATVSELKDTLWADALEISFLDPKNLLTKAPYAALVMDIISKQVTGHHITIIDPWARLLAYHLLKGKRGGVSTTLSSITKQATWSSHDGPFPVLLTLGAKPWLHQCGPSLDATTYEFTPYEFGSWDSEVSAFTPTDYLGTAMKGGKPSGWACTKNYDNLGFVLGTSSALFNDACQMLPQPKNNTDSLADTLSAVVAHVHNFAAEDLYSRFKNPFYEWQSPTGVHDPNNDFTSHEYLHMVDGGEAMQNNPIWPFIQPARNVDVIIANDNSADTKHSFPNGSEILATYQQSVNRGLTRMPFIPPVEEFMEKGMDRKAAFFGCGDKSKTTIVWLPNAKYTYDSGKSTFDFVYSKGETDKMVANGMQVATQGGKENWATCLGCAFLEKREGKLPKECKACFDEYCYKQ